MRRGASGKLPPLAIALLIVFPIAAACATLGMGRMQIEPGQLIAAVMQKITGEGDVPKTVMMTVFNVRLPRILLALLTGAGLSLSGCAFQSLFANPLATPDTLGVASGSCFGAALGILLGFGFIGIQTTSFLFGAIAVALTYIAGSGKGKGLSSIVLSGIMIGSLFSALVSLVKFTADSETQLPAITYWLMGSLEGTGYDNLVYGAPPVLVGCVVLFLIRWRMNLLPLTEDEIRSSGMNIAALRGTTIVAATMMTASCVSMCGQVGWVGLLVPHVCRMMFGSNHLSLVPASISIGAGFMVIVDTVARAATAAEIPISILTAIIGAPFFITLMRRSGGWRL